MHVPIGDIVRVGSRSKSTLLQPRNLKQLLMHGSPLVTGKGSAVDQQTDDTARTQRQELGQLIPQLKALSARRRKASLISVDTALAAFLARADERQLEQMWGRGSRFEHSLRQLAALIQKTLTDHTANFDRNEHFSFFREACRFCVLAVQKHAHVEEASRIELSWEAHLLTGSASKSDEKQLLQTGYAVLSKFKQWFNTPSAFEYIQKRVRPAVLPDTIASSGVDASISLVETSDMIDVVSVSSRRRMAGDDSGSLRSSSDFVDISSRSNVGELRLDELEQPLTQIERQSLRACDNIWQRQPHDVPLLLMHMCARNPRAPCCTLVLRRRPTLRQVHGGVPSVHRREPPRA